RLAFRRKDGEADCGGYDDACVVIDAAFSAFMQDDGTLPCGLGLNLSFRDGAEGRVLGTRPRVADGITVDMPHIGCRKAGPGCEAARCRVPVGSACGTLFVGNTAGTLFRDA